MVSKEIFQIDHPSVKATYDSDNYKIVLDEAQPKEKCAIYFSSNDIYFPNNVTEFNRKITDADSYEWFKTRVPGVYKHIYFRDIHKQWYLTGINSRISTPEALLEFIQKEVSGFRVTTVGSSAGGYAAVLYGSLIFADIVFSFNGQFSLFNILEESSAEVDPLVFRFQYSNRNKYYDLINFVGSKSNITYFNSALSIQDSWQKQHISSCLINVIEFKTRHHGIPFLKCALRRVLSMNNSQLRNLSQENRINSPVFFSFKMAGFWSALFFSIRLAVGTFYKKMLFIWGVR